MFSGKMKKKSAFFADVLGVSNTKVHVRYRELEDSSGFTEQLAEDKYLITIAKGLDRDQRLEVLAHEMVHVQQYVTGRLKDVERAECIWEGKAYQQGNSMDDYFLAPWEMEARAMEAYLTYRWDSNDVHTGTSKTYH